MPKQVDEYVAENRSRIRGVDARFTQVDSNRTRNFKFGPSKVTVDVEIELYKRSTGSQVIFGHADDAHGFGRGTFGHDNDAWSLVTDAEASVAFTRLGRKAVVESLDGKAGAVVSGAAGTDSTDATTTDTALGNETERPFAFTTKDAGNTVRAKSIYSSTNPTGLVEYGLFDGDDRLLARVTVSSPAVATDDEVRADIIVSFVGSGIGNSVITNDGESVIADAFSSPTVTTGPTEFRFGSGSTAFSKSDSGLTTEEFTKACVRETGRDTVNAITHVYEEDPNASHSIDISEMGVFDDSNTMIWATTLRSYEKTDEVGFNAESLIQIA